MSTVEYLATHRSAPLPRHYTLEVTIGLTEGEERFLRSIHEEEGGNPGNFHRWLIAGIEEGVGPVLAPFVDGEDGRRVWVSRWRGE